MEGSPDRARPGGLGTRLRLAQLARRAVGGAPARVLLAGALVGVGIRVGAELAGDPVVVLPAPVSEAASVPQERPGPGVGPFGAARAAEPAPPAAESDEPEQAALPETAAQPSVPAGLVDINRATAEELDGLPGIGPVLARRIVEFRERHGPFALVEDLLEVPGIGPRILERLRPLVTVGPPGP